VEASTRKAGEFAVRRFRERRRAWRRQVWWAIGAPPVLLAPLTVALGLLQPTRFQFFLGFGIGAALMMIFALADSPPPHIERWREGAEGEKATARALRRLASGGWTLTHDLQMGPGNVDHILIGPAGVFLLESKRLRGVISVRSGDLRIRWREDLDDGYARTSVGARAKARSAELSKVLRRPGPGRIWVQPTVVLWGDFEQRSVLSGGVAWVSGKHLASVLARRPVTLSDADVAQLTTAVRNAFCER
jgi:hypothetical protein